MNDVGIRTMVVLIVVGGAVCWWYLCKKQGWAFEWGFVGGLFIAMAVGMTAAALINWIITGDTSTGVIQQ